MLPAEQAGAVPVSQGSKQHDVVKVAEQRTEAVPFAQDFDVSEHKCWRQDITPKELFDLEQL